VPSTAVSPTEVSRLTHLPGSSRLTCWPHWLLWWGPMAWSLFSNAALEDALGISRRTIVGSSLADAFTEPALQNALHGVRDNEFAVLRYDAFAQARGGMSPCRCM
jgi:hypothetical protein